MVKAILLLILQVAAEVSRLEELKASKMKELVLKKEAELEDICKRTHLIPEINSAMETTMLAIDSGIYLRSIWILLSST